MEEESLETDESMDRGKIYIEVKGQGKCAYQQLFDGRFYILFTHIDEKGEETATDAQLVSSKDVLLDGIATAQKMLETQGKPPLQVVDHSFKSEEELQSIMKAYHKDIGEKKSERRMGFLK